MMRPSTCLEYSQLVVVLQSFTVPDVDCGCKQVPVSKQRADAFLQRALSAGVLLITHQVALQRSLHGGILPERVVLLSALLHGAQAHKSRLPDTLALPSARSPSGAEISAMVERWIVDECVESAGF